MSGRTRKFGLNGEDIQLWHRVIDGVRPLKGFKDQSPLPGKKPEPVVKKQTNVPRSSTPTAPEYYPPQASIRSRQNHQPIETRLMKRLARQDDQIHAVLDLHGMRQVQAHDALDRFIRSSCMQGHRIVLVITGKGKSNEGNGVLRSQVPKWLAAPGLRPLIVAVKPAHRHRGGEGALYVQLRRPDRVRS